MPVPVRLPEFQEEIYNNRNPTRAERRHVKSFCRLLYPFDNKAAKSIYLFMKKDSEEYEKIE